jgi:hypothetical protein
VNLQQYRDRVILLLGNPPKVHPILQMLDEWINDAIRDVPQRTLTGPFDRRTLFPELTRHTLVQVAENQAWVQAPPTMLAPLYAFCYENESEPNLDFDQPSSVSFLEYDEYQVLDKGGEDWTRIMARFDDRLYIWPTPVEGKQGWISLFYLYEQEYLSVPEQTPMINRRWDRAICNLATAFGEAAQNHKERAAFFEAEANKQMAAAMNWIGMHQQRTPWANEIDGDVSAEETYS